MYLIVESYGAIVGQHFEELLGRNIGRITKKNQENNIAGITSAVAC